MNTNHAEQNLVSFFNYILENNNIADTILILPTQKWVMKAKKDFASLYYNRTGKAASNLHFYRLDDLGRKCLDYLNSDYRLINDTMVFAFFVEAINNVRDKLQYFKHRDNHFNRQNALSPSIIQNIKDVILGLKEDGITAESMLNDVSADLPIANGTKRFMDFQIIYEQYEYLLNYNNYIDSVGIYNKLVNLLDKRNLVGLFNKDSFMFFYGFTEFKLPETRFISSLSKSNYTIKINMFRSDFSDNLQEQITILAADNRIYEVKQLAKLIKHLHINKNISYNKMCVCSRNPSIYADLFREYFSESGIIVNISDRFDLTTSNSVVLIFALLDIVSNKWKKTDLERIKHYKEIDDLESLNDVSDFKSVLGRIQTLIKVSERYRIFGGSSAYIWKYQLDKYRKQLYKRYEQNDYNNPKQAEIAKQISDLTKAIDSIQTIEANLIKNGKYTLKDFASEIHNLIERLKIKEHISKRQQKILNNSMANNNFYTIEQHQLLEELEKNINSLQKFEQILDEIVSVWTERFGMLKYKLKDIIEWLKVILTSTKYQIADKNLGVNITSIEQTRGMEYDVVILCGAIEGEFPLTFRSNTLLGKELPDSEQRHNKNEKILFTQFLTNNETKLNSGEMKLYISYPQKDKSGNSLIRSSFIDSLNQLINKDKTIELSNSEVANEKLEWYKYIVQNDDIYNYNVHNELNQNLISYNNKLNANLKEYAGNSLKLTEQSKKYSEELINNWNTNGYSVSKLETYANCPFQFFIQNILNIKTEEEESDEKLSALDLGNYIHKILEIFYKQNLEKHNNRLLNIPYFDVNNITDNYEIKKKYLDELIEIANPLFRPLNIPLFKYEIKKIISENGLLSKWLDNEISKRKEWNYNSIYFEYNFLDKLEFNNQEIKLQGKIDRTEIDRNKHFIVVDYKLSKGNTLNNINEGTSLQLPIYMKIMQKKLGDEFIPAGGGYYIIKAEENKDYAKWAIKLRLDEEIEKGMKKSVLDTDDFNNTLDKSLEYIMLYKENIEQNIFNITTNDKNCQYCHFKQICYKQTKL